MRCESIVKHCNNILGYDAYELKHVNRHKPERYDCDQVDALVARVKSFEGFEGWLCFQSGVHRVEKGPDLQNLPTNLGYLLSGELVNDGLTVSIQQNNDKWYLSIIEETSAKTADSQQVISTARKLCVLKKFSAASRINNHPLADNTDEEPIELAEYRVYFEKGESDYRPNCFRLTGFTTTGGSQ